MPFNFSQSDLKREDSTMQCHQMELIVCQVLVYVLVHNRSIISARKPNYAQKIIYVVSVIQRV